MKDALKEWAVVVDALGTGGQILILRKGGIREGRGGFAVDRQEFWLFPTLHQQRRAAVIPAAQTRYDALTAAGQDAERVEIRWFARVVAWQRLEPLAAAERLRGQHIWRDEVIASRFEWGREQGIHAIAVRVFAIPAPRHLRMVPSYGGCTSWIRLEEEISTDGAEPVLTDAAFAAKLKTFHTALDRPAALA